MCTLISSSASTRPLPPCSRLRRSSFKALALDVIFCFISLHLITSLAGIHNLIAEAAPLPIDASHGGNQETSGRPLRIDFMDLEGETHPIVGNAGGCFNIRPAEWNPDTDPDQHLLTVDMAEQGAVALERGWPDRLLQRTGASIPASSAASGQNVDFRLSSYSFVSATFASPLTLTYFFDEPDCRGTQMETIQGGPQPGDEILFDHVAKPRSVQLETFYVTGRDGL